MSARSLRSQRGMPTDHLMTQLPPGPSPASDAGGDEPELLGQLCMRWADERHTKPGGGARIFFSSRDAGRRGKSGRR